MPLDSMVQILLGNSYNEEERPKVVFSLINVYINSSLSKINLILAWDCVSDYFLSPFVVNREKIHKK